MTKQLGCIRGFEKILVATDGSAFSKAAVEEAIRIAASSSARMFVILVVEISADVEMWDASGAEKIERESRKHLDGIRARAERQGVFCETALHFGDEPYRDIVNEAERRKATVIVMGSHGRTGLTRLMMGSVVSRVIGHAPCKVLVVPPKKR
jgi:nucleotide-binding universal stress UspA family protein